jgi:hypothetical protein
MRKLNLQSSRGAQSVLILWLISCVGCAHQANAAGPSGTPTTQPSKLQTLRLSDAIDLDKLTKDTEVNLTHQLNLSHGGRIYFGELDSYDDDDNQTASIPILAKKVHGQWKALPINDSRLKNANWAYVAAGPNRGEVWGVLDASLDDNQPDLLLAHSTDGGATFELSPLHKPDEVASFESFCIGPDNKGRITVYVSSEDDAKTAKPGYYNFRTTDGGKTWSPATDYEPDAMTPAKDVPDEDQPDSDDAKGKAVSGKAVSGKAI